VAKKMTEEGYPITSACELLGLPQSTYYYQPVQADEAGLEEAIKDLVGQIPTYGTRRIIHQLRQSPFSCTLPTPRTLPKFPSYTLKPLKPWG